MKSRHDIFEATCLSEFSYLSDYGFTLVKTDADNYGRYLTYKNQWIALRVALVGSGIEIVFYLLRDGVIPSYPIFFSPKEDFNVFNATDLLVIKTGTNIEQNPRLLYEEHYLRAKVKEMAELLRRHASDVFRGNFEVVPKIRELVVRRWCELKDEQN